MSAMEKVFENAVKLIAQNIPKETLDRLAILAQTGVGLKEQLDRIEAAIGELDRKYGELLLLLASHSQPEPEREAQHGPEAERQCPSTFDFT